MTIQEIKDLLTGIDPDVQRYDHDRADFHGDGRTQGGIRFQVDRFTKEEDDATAAALLEALEGNDFIAVDYLVDYERDTGFIHHIFDCEGC